MALQAIIKRSMLGCRGIPVNIAKPLSDIADKPRVVIRCWIINDRIHRRRMVVEV